MTSSHGITKAAQVALIVFLVLAANFGQAQTDKAKRPIEPWPEKAKQYVSKYARFYQKRLLYAQSAEAQAADSAESRRYVRDCRDFLEWASKLPEDFAIVLAEKPESKSIYIREALYTLQIYYGNRISFQFDNVRDFALGGTPTRDSANPMSTAGKFRYRLAEIIQFCQFAPKDLLSVIPPNQLLGQAQTWIDEMRSDSAMLKEFDDVFVGAIASAIARLPEVSPQEFRSMAEAQINEWGGGKPGLDLRLRHLAGLPIIYYQNKDAPTVDSLASSYQSSWMALRGNMGSLGDDIWRTHPRLYETRLVALSDWVLHELEATKAAVDDLKVLVEIAQRSKAISPGDSIKQLFPNKEVMDSLNQLSHSMEELAAPFAIPSSDDDSSEAIWKPVGKPNEEAVALINQIRSLSEMHRQFDVVGPRVGSARDIQSLSSIVELAIANIEHPLIRLGIFSQENTENQKLKDDATMIGRRLASIKSSLDSLKSLLD
jgi:hypothetical protein